MSESQEMTIPAVIQKLSDLLENHPETFATGNPEIQAAALDATKHIFDFSLQSESSSMPFIGSFLSSLSPSQAPQTRSKSKIQEQNRDEKNVKDIFDFTPLASLYVENTNEEQVWAQLDLRTKAVCQMLNFILEGSETPNGGESREDEEITEMEAEDLETILAALKSGKDVDMKFLEYLLGNNDINMEDAASDEFSANEAESDNSLDSTNIDEIGVPLRDSSPEVQHSKKQPKLKLGFNSVRKSKRSNTSPIDDDFFILAEFNADSERAESKSSSRGHLAAEDDDSEAEEMDIDLFTSINPSDNDDEEDLDHTGGELFYRDFFEPPSRFANSAPTPSQLKGKDTNQVHFHERVRVKKIKATGKNRPLNVDSDDENDSDALGDSEDDDVLNKDSSEEETDSDEAGKEEEEGDSDMDEDNSDGDSNKKGDETISRLKEDIFAEEEKVQKDLTTHERRMTTLKEQIEELEAENVTPKEWVLMGEASSRQRPQNSLLEEDLEFDRVMKAVPVTTEESVKTLEEVIKARILEGRFDDVIRIRPMDGKPFLPSKLLELQDTKSTQSLAQIYENDYMTSLTGGELSDDRDGRLQKEHEEITLLWDKICGKLDALCNAHFVPKQPKATISTVMNIATATLESALPTSKSTSTMLAPEEVFSVASSSLRDRNELTPSEKRALRSKERKLKKRQRDALNKGVDKFAKPKGVGGVKKQKQKALESVVKQGKGVTVVGKSPLLTVRSKDKRL